MWVEMGDFCLSSFDSLKSLFHFNVRPQKDSHRASRPPGLLVRRSALHAKSLGGQIGRPSDHLREKHIHLLGRWPRVLRDI